jgi:hypothetical protein
MSAPFAEGPLRQSIRHLLNSDLEASKAVLNGYLRELPDDPLAHALWAAVRFYHYVSIRIPEQDTKTIVGVLLGAGLPMPQALQKEIGAGLRRSQTLASRSIAAAPADPAALLALCIVESVNRDGLALVSKRWSASLAHAERAHVLARRLLDREPLAHDAYFVFGSTEYLVARIPVAMRTFVRVAGVAGDRKKAVAYCQTAAKSGWFFREFASRTLANLYIDEGRFAEAEKLLAALVEEFPGNDILRADWLKVQARCRLRA